MDAQALAGCPAISQVPSAAVSSGGPIPSLSAYHAPAIPSSELSAHPVEFTTSLTSRVDAPASAARSLSPEVGSRHSPLGPEQSFRPRQASGEVHSASKATLRKPPRTTREVANELIAACLARPEPTHRTLALRH